MDAMNIMDNSSAEGALANEMSSKKSKLRPPTKFSKVEIAEYLAPRTVLDDNKTYSTIHESQIYQDEDGSGDEEEKKGSGASDTRSFQSE